MNCFLLINVKIPTIVVLYLGYVLKTGLILLSVCIEEELMPDGTTKWVDVTSPDLTQSELEDIFEGKNVTVDEDRTDIIIYPNNTNGEPEEISEVTVIVKGGNINVSIIIFFPNNTVVEVSAINTKISRARENVPS